MTDTTTANVSPQEIAQFNQLAASWWDPAGEMKSLHDINPLRMRYIQDHVSLDSKQVLDIGCGAGILSEALAAAGAKVYGIDMADEVIQAAKLHQLESNVNVEYHCDSAEQFATMHAGQFDVITCMEMLEHVPNPQSIIASCYQLLKPGGRLFLSTLNRSPKSFLFAIVGAEYVLKLLPKGTHRYKQFIKPSELAHALRQENLQLKDSCGLVYNPLTKTFALKTNDISVNYLVYATKDE